MIGTSQEGFEQEITNVSLPKCDRESSSPTDSSHLKGLYIAMRYCTPHKEVESVPVLAVLKFHYTKASLVTYVDK